MPSRYRKRRDVPRRLAIKKVGNPPNPLSPPRIKRYPRRASDPGFSGSSDPYGPLVFKKGQFPPMSYHSVMNPTTHKIPIVDARMKRRPSESDLGEMYTVYPEHLRSSNQNWYPQAQGVFEDETAPSWVHSSAYLPLNMAPKRFAKGPGVKAHKLLWPGKLNLGQAPTHVGSYDDISTLEDYMKKHVKKHKYFAPTKAAKQKEFEKYQKAFIEHDRRVKSAKADKLLMASFQMDPRAYRRPPPGLVPSSTSKSILRRPPGRYAKCHAVPSLTKTEGLFHPELPYHQPAVQYLTAEQLRDLLDFRKDQMKRFLEQRQPDNILAVQQQRIDDVEKVYSEVLAETEALRKRSKGKKKTVKIVGPVAAAYFDKTEVDYVSPWIRPEVVGFKKEPKFIKTKENWTDLRDKIGFPY